LGHAGASGKREWGRFHVSKEKREETVGEETSDPWAWGGRERKGEELRDSSRAGLLGRWLRAGPAELVSLFFVLLSFLIFCFVLYLLHFGSKTNQTKMQNFLKYQRSF
jgi:hypothetical protein